LLPPEPKKPKEPKLREPDPIWDYVCKVFKLNPQTKTERTRTGRVVRDLKQKGATPEEIERRLQLYRREWPKAADTPEAILKHWDRYGEERGESDQQRKDRLQAEKNNGTERVNATIWFQSLPKEDRQQWLNRPELKTVDGPEIEITAYRLHKAS